MEFVQKQLRNNIPSADAIEIRPAVDPRAVAAHRQGCVIVRDRNDVQSHRGLWAGACVSARRAGHGRCRQNEDKSCEHSDQFLGGVQHRKPILLEAREP
jgi:hypothetical protein